MKYKLKRTRYLAVVGDIPTSREFTEGTLFIKEGVSGEIVLISCETDRDDLLHISKETLRNDFEAQWEKTSLFEEGRWS